MISVTTKIGAMCFTAMLASAGFAEAKTLPDYVAKAEAPAADAEVMSAEELGALSGGAAIHDSILTDQTLTALVQGNKVIGDVVTSGDIRLDASAFTGFDGIGNFVLNTGHNNALQSSMNVSILLASPE